MTTTMHQAQPTTWEDVWSRSDETISARRLEREQTMRRWSVFEQAVARQFDGQPIRCVELGAGEGDFSVLLARLGAAVTLVDFSVRALDRARRRFDRLGLEAEFVQGDLFEFGESEAGRFDVSMSFGLVEHFNGRMRQRVIDAHRQVLRTGGLTMISAPHALCFPYELRRMYLKIRGWWPYGFLLPYTGWELRRRGRAAGFTDVRSYNTGFAASVDACLIELFAGRRFGWGDGPAWANALFGWDVNMLATAA